MIIAVLALVAAALFALGLLVSDRHPLVGMALAVAVSVNVNVARVAYDLWAGNQGWVTVDGDELVVRPGRVLTQRYRLRACRRVTVHASRWRGTTLSLRDGREVPLPSLCEQDVQRLGELLQAATDPRSAPGTAGPVGAGSAAPEVPEGGVGSARGRARAGR